MEKLEVKLPLELAERIDRALELLGFKSREELVLSAVRRYLDRYRILETVQR